MTIKAGYCTAVYADTINSSTEWLVLSNDEKEFAISMGRNYIDSKYSCLDSSNWDTTDSTTIPTEVQWSNATLAEQYAQGTLTTTSAYSGPITKKKVKAGDAEVETTYQGLYSSSGGKTKDPFSEVTLMLSAYCTYGNSSRTLIRV